MFARTPEGGIWCEGTGQREKEGPDVRGLGGVVRKRNDLNRAHDENRGPSIQVRE